MEGLRSLHPLDYIIIISYFTIVVTVGIFFSRFIKQAKDYFAAGAAVPWWLAGISLWMASFSALMFVVYSELAYKLGMVAVTLCWVVIPSMVLAAAIFAPRWRRTRVLTPLGFMEQRYNKFVHQLFVWTGIPLRLIDNSIKIYSTAIFLAVAVGQSWFTLEVCIAVVGVIMVLYTLLGGQWAVIVTDFVQFTILVVAVLILFPLSLIAVGGFGGLISQAPEGYFNILAKPYGPFDWLMFCVIIAISYNATWGLVQKYNCVETEMDARKVAILMGTLSAIGPIFFFIPAMAARILLPELMTQDGGSRIAYVSMCLKVLPAGVMGLMVAGMFSATLSTLGSEYNVLSGVLTKDFYGKVVNPDASESTLIRWGRINTAIIGVITIFFALGISLVRGFNLYDIMVKAFGALGPAIMLPLLGGLLIKRVNSKGAVTGVLTGTLSGIGLVVVNFMLLAKYGDQLADNPTLSYWLKQGWNSASIPINILTSLAGMWLGSVMTKTPSEETERVDEFFERMSVPTEAYVSGEEDEKQSPFVAVGIALMSLGSIVLLGAVYMAFSGDMTAFFIDALAGGFMAVAGCILWLKNRRR